MKPLGIVRKVDDLGRIVIPKEIRKQNGWPEGTLFELFATEDGFFFREYSRDYKIKQIVSKLNEADEKTQDDTVKEAIQMAKSFIGSKHIQGVE